MAATYRGCPQSSLCPGSVYCELLLLLLPSEEREVSSSTPYPRALSEPVLRDCPSGMRRLVL